MNATASKATPPSTFCEDFALVPRGAHEGKPPVTFSRPVNLLSAAANDLAASTAPAAYVLVLNLDGQLYIRDLTGTASLHWNGNPTAQANLRNGDKVRLGKIEYEVLATRFAAPPQDASPAPSAELIPTSGGPAKKIHAPVSLIGASEHAELRTGSDNASEAIAVILRIGQGYWLWNLEPASPCRLNGEAVVRAALEEGGVVRMGGEEFRFHLQQTPPAKAAPKLPVMRAIKKGTARPEAALAAPPAAVAPKPPARPSEAPVTPPPAVPMAQVKSQPPLPPRPAKASPAPIAAAPPVKSIQPTQPPPRAAVAPVAAEPIASGEGALDDDADVFKQWGPLAFAVAAADHPELQAGGSKSGMNAAVPPPAVPTVTRSRKLTWITAILLLLAGGAFLAWKYHLLPKWR